MGASAAKVRERLARSLAGVHGSSKSRRERERRAADAIVAALFDEYAKEKRSREKAEAWRRRKIVEQAVSFRENHKLRLREIQGLLCALFPGYREETRKHQNRNSTREYVRRIGRKHYERVKEWRAKNPEKAYAANARRRARQRGCDSDAAIAAARRKLSRKKLEDCSWCGRQLPGHKLELDHVVALSIGGAHSVKNLTPSCRACNSRKRNKPLDVWLQEIRGEAQARRELREWETKLFGKRLSGRDWGRNGGRE